MIIKRKQLESEWFSYSEKSKFLVRPFPRFTVLDKDKDSERMWMSFEYALQGWEGLEEEDGSKFEFTEENKRILFDFIVEIVNFVFEKANEKYIKISEQIKNS
jgi:hypothetical protein